MKYLIIPFLFIIAISLTGQERNFSPTGTYILNDTIDRDAGRIFSYFGDLQVVQHGNDSIIINFFICVGEPSYNSGTFYDTINFQNNYAEYTTEFDPSCRIRLTFDKNGVQINQTADNPNFCCGFGHAVSVNEYYKKTSGKRPELIDFGTGESLEEN